jgi:superfamily I DNA/RNA helicase
MPYINAEDWRPVGVDDLEPAAWSVLRSRKTCCVVAGPGAGKTELLAQRAAYLFQTGLCADPYRILAISFKRDAAYNLRERIRKRCSPEQARRFESVTFDAFTKNLVDRFITALPILWRLQDGYEVEFPRSADVRKMLQRACNVSRDDWVEEISNIPSTRFEPVSVGTWRLPITRTPVATGTEYAIVRWWVDHIRKRCPAAVTFTMLNRLAEVIQRSNPEIGRALRLTYPYIFVDECQDTTYAQYDFLTAVFNKNAAVVTAVGDEKQRIMGWAGACIDIFSRFENDFEAERIPLRCNYRSSPELVRIQQVLAKKLDTNAVTVESKAPDSILATGDPAQIWLFNTEDEEALRIATWINDDMAVRKQNPRDYALLVRQTADRFEARLAPYFQAFGLNIRNESRAVGRSSVQDLLAEPLTTLSLAFLRLSTRDRDPESWSAAARTLMLLRGVDPDEVDNLGSAQRVESELTSFIDRLRITLHQKVDPAICASLIDEIVTFIGDEAAAEVFPEYRDGDNLAIAKEALAIFMTNCAGIAEIWSDVLDILEGVNCIPLMTVHKSKGLEFNTILFVGLDDAMWWSYSPDNPEGLATLFVALSRARQHANFTYCSERGERKRIAELFELFREAGVEEVVI